MEAGFLDSIVKIISDGGYLMYPLILVALLIYGTAWHVYFYFSRHRFYKSSRLDWERWMKDPDSLTGDAAAVVHYVMDGAQSVAALRGRFQEVRLAYLSYPNARYRFLQILIGCAPLMGLLGTVTGMLTTFRGLATSRGGDTVDQIAGGISEALITTETGLLIAIVAYIPSYFIAKRSNDMANTLTGMETVFVQHFNKKQ